MDSSFINYVCTSKIPIIPIWVCHWWWQEVALVCLIYHWRQALRGKCEYEYRENPGILCLVLYDIVIRHYFYYFPFTFCWKLVWIFMDRRSCFCKYSILTNWICFYCFFFVSSTDDSVPPLMLRQGFLFQLHPNSLCRNM